MWRERDLYFKLINESILPQNVKVPLPIKVFKGTDYYSSELGYNLENILDENLFIVREDECQKLAINELDFEFHKFMDGDSIQRVLLITPSLKMKTLQNKEEKDIEGRFIVVIYFNFYYLGRSEKVESVRFIPEENFQRNQIINRRLGKFLSKPPMRVEKGPFILLQGEGSFTKGAR